MTRLGDVVVSGTGFWSPRLPGWDLARDVALGLAAAPQGPVPRPAPALLAPTERRRAPDTVALALEVANRACQMAAVDPKDVSSVFASTYGDLPISDYMCATLATTPTLCSPTKFHNSVHNAAAGYWSIGTGSRRPSTALLAGPYTFAAGLLEAVSQVLADPAPVLLVAYDVAARGALATTTHSEGLLAAALLLAPAAAGVPGARLACSVEERAADTVSAGDAVPPAWLDVLPANAMRPCLPLMAALAIGRDSRLTWPLGAGSRLVLDLRFAA